MEQQILTAWLCFWLAVFGAVFGSFLDCAASRWAAGDPHPFAGRSRCASCGHALGARDLVPVASFLTRRGLSLRHNSEPTRLRRRACAGVVVKK
ncbi:MAG: prepilin peptidase, partial [Dysosmobacter sp.]|nr:prepilin peptidase [Dysosmobacter sp.]